MLHTTQFKTQFKSFQPYAGHISLALFSIAIHLLVDISIRMKCPCLLHRKIISPGGKKTKHPWLYFKKIFSSPSDIGNFFLTLFF